jgi:hypothetical protein
MLASKNLLANQISIKSEPFRRTDISTQPLGPTNYTGSNTATSKPMIDQLEQLNFGLEHLKKVMRPLGELEEVKK